MKCFFSPISGDFFKIRNTVEVTGLREEIYLPLLLVLRSQAGRRLLAHFSFQRRWSCASSWSVPGMKAPRHWTACQRPQEGDLKASDFQVQCSECLTVSSGRAYAACSHWRAGKHSRGWTCLHFRGMMLWSLLSPSRFCSPSHSGCCWDSTSQSRKLSKKRKLFCLRSKSEVRKVKKKVISACSMTKRRAPEDIPGGSVPDQREARRGCEQIDDRISGLSPCPHARPLELQRPWVIWPTQKWSPLQGIPWVLQGHSFLSVSTKRVTQISQIQILSPFQNWMYHKVKKKKEDDILMITSVVLDPTPWVKWESLAPYLCGCASKYNKI